MVTRTPTSQNFEVNQPLEAKQQTSRTFDRLYVKYHC
jgi:hypothetical protein